ncbi:MAG: RsfS/YbeB/iojap family protein, partial [Vulcanococcus sp.]
MAEAQAAKPSPDPNRPRLDLDDSKALALLAADACDDRKATDIVLIRVEEISSIADWFVIASGFTDVQVRAMGRSVEDKLEEHTGRLPLRKEGQN